MMTAASTCTENPKVQCSGIVCQNVSDFLCWGDHIYFAEAVKYPLAVDDPVVRVYVRSRYATIDAKNEVIVTLVTHPNRTVSDLGIEYSLVLVFISITFAFAARASSIGQS